MGGIWLVRHAPTSWTGKQWCGRSDPPLTADGEADAVRLGARLRSYLEPGDIMVSSPARRALATATSLVGRAARPIVIEAALAEIDFGEADGLTFEEIESRYPAVARRLAAGQTNIDWPAGEAAADVRARAARAWEKLVAMTPRRTVVAVTHGGLTAVILREVLGEDDQTATFREPATAINLEQAHGSWRVNRQLSANDPARGPGRADRAAATSVR
jgi:broad specificity phosphatase PhoE